MWPTKDSFSTISSSMVCDISTYDASYDLYSPYREIENRLDKIEKRLLILQRDMVMEEKYPRLKEIYDLYQAELDKYSMIEKIKDSK